MKHCFGLLMIDLLLLPVVARQSQELLSRVRFAHQLLQLRMRVMIAIRSRGKVTLGVCHTHESE